MKRKVCKRCKSITDGAKCHDPQCQGIQNGQLAQGFKGRIFIMDPVKSEIAKKVNITNVGEYAIKVS